MTTAALPRWPDYALPAPSLNDQLAQSYPDLILRTDFEQGAPRQRQLYTSGTTVQWITWPMDPTQLRIFHGFWVGEISNGNDWFTLSLFNDDEYRNFTVRFVGTAGQPVKITRSGGEWIYAAQIETLDDTSPDENETAELLLTYQQTMTLDAIVQLFHTTVQGIAV